MALERDNTAERLARIDALVAENTLTRAEQPITRLQPIGVVSLPQGPVLAVGPCAR